MLLCFQNTLHLDLSTGLSENTALIEKCSVIVDHYAFG